MSQAATNKTAHKYFAFISYSHQDNLGSRKSGGRGWVRWAEWLHSGLETFQTPPELIEEYARKGEEIPARLFPVFQDEKELPLDADLAAQIRQGLEDSQYLIVICSPRSAKSKYVNEEVRYFKELGRGGNILALIIDGEPNATDKEALGYTRDQECFCPAIRHALDANHQVDPSLPTLQEPIAGDVRLDVGGGHREMRRNQVWREHDLLDYMKLKLIAGLLGTGFDDLFQRDKVRQAAEARRRALRLQRLVAGFAFLALVALGAAVYAFQQRDVATDAQALAEDRTREVRAAASTAQFTGAARSLEADNPQMALAQLAQALRIDPGNEKAALRLATLLAQRSWPVELRKIPQPFPIKKLRFHPDGKRLIMGISLDEYGASGTGSVQIWDWTKARLLAQPLIAGRSDPSNLFTSADGNTLSVTWNHRFSFNYAFQRVPPLDAPPVTLSGGNIAWDVGEFGTCTDLSGDGQFALASDNIETVLFSDEDELPPSFPVAELVGDVEIKTLAFQGSELLVLSTKGEVIRIDAAQKKVISREPVKDLEAEIINAEFGKSTSHLALLLKDGEMRIYDWRAQNWLTKSQSLTDEGSWVRKVPAYDLDEGQSALDQVVFRFDDRHAILETLVLPDPDDSSFIGSTIWQYTVPDDEYGVSRDFNGLPKGQRLSQSGILEEKDGNKLFLARAGEPTLLCEPLPHESAIFALEIFSDSLFATGTQDGFARVWSRLPAAWSGPPAPETPAQAESTTDDEDIEWRLIAQHGDLTVWTSDRRGWSVQVKVGGKAIEVAQPPGDGLTFRNGTYSRDGKFLALSGWNGLEGSTAGAYEHGAVLLDSRTGQAISKFVSHGDCAWAGVDNTNRWLVTAGGGRLQFWDVQNGTEPGLRLQHSYVQEAAWIPGQDNRLLSLGSDGRVILWDLDRQSVIYEIQWQFPRYAAERQWLPDERAALSALVAPDAKTFLLLDAKMVQLRDLATGIALSDPVPVESAGAADTYETLRAKLGWATLDARFSEPGVNALVAAADAAAGFRLGEDGAIVTIEDRGNAFRTLKLKAGRLPDKDPLKAWLGKMAEDPAVTPLLDSTPAELDANIKEGQAAYQLALSANLLGVRPGKSPNAEDGLLHPDADIFGSRDFMETVEADIREARRLSPAATERILAKLMAEWEVRDVDGIFAAVYLGSRNPAALATVKAHLEKLRARMEAGNSGQDSTGEDIDSSVLLEWEAKLAAATGDDRSIRQEIAIMSALDEAHAESARLVEEHARFPDRALIREQCEKLHSLARGLDAEPRWPARTAWRFAKNATPWEPPADQEELEARLTVASQISGLTGLAILRECVLPYLPEPDDRRPSVVLALADGLAAYAGQDGWDEAHANIRLEVRKTALELRDMAGPLSGEEKEKQEELISKMDGAVPSEIFGALFSLQSGQSLLADLLKDPVPTPASGAEGDQSEALAAVSATFQDYQNKMEAEFWRALVKGWRAGQKGVILSDAITNKARLQPFMAPERLKPLGLTEDELKSIEELRAAMNQEPPKVP
jgi:WD40 repeat protein